MLSLRTDQLDRFIWKVYNLSKPAGMGYLTAQKGDLTEYEIDQVKFFQLKFNSLRSESEGKRILLDLDYLKGRRVKIQVWIDKENKFWIRDSWEDHTKEEFRELLDFCKIPEPD